MTNLVKPDHRPKDAAGVSATHNAIGILAFFKTMMVRLVVPRGYDKTIGPRAVSNSMARFRHESPEQRQARFEQFEQRLVMSAQAVASILPELEIAAPAITQQVVTHPLLNNVAATTQAADIARQYGFDGAGQTVAVIDSGIAWDHYALGGGFGAGHKVVGGWDFAENDANPYDDGPAGFHGTHVSGIIGSTDDRYHGVSSGVDLVGLRVFDDQGAGDLAWVEQALQWVHDHRNDFANPITTVVMSLGTEWNAFNTPQWATLEEEFARLEADGLFISVAAGNAFETYHTPGLSYPAVSQSVVPVASHDANGEISDFSQRAANVLVAPGESIVSTVPNHLFGGLSSNRFLGSTGTSMAAPYVAGASAVLRQANEFMGVTGVTQDMLYQQFRDTADRIFDAATGGYYYKINLEAALAAVVTDLNDDSASTATNIGRLMGGEKIAGTIGQVTDVDHFSFTANSTGQVSLKFNVTHDLKAEVNVNGSLAQRNGNDITFFVEAGRQYSFSVGTSEGTGRYTIDTKLTAGVPAINWGNVVAKTIANQQISGQAMYRIQASRDGFMTVQTTADQSSSLTLEIYDSQMNRIGTGTGNGANVRLDVIAAQGETYYLKASGTATGVDFRLENLVSLSAGKLSINGTDQNDTILVDASNGFSITLNGTGYQFQNSQVQNIQINGYGGNDQLDLKLGALNDTVSTNSSGLTVVNDRFQVNATGTENLIVNAGMGRDVVSMLDTLGNDTFNSTVNSATLSGAGYSSTVIGFDVVQTKSSGGIDLAEMQGTAGSDFLNSQAGRNALHAGGGVVVVEGFSSVRINGLGGQDRASLIDSAANDKFVLRPSYVHMANQQSRLWASSFESISVVGGRGQDQISIHDSVLNDVFSLDNGVATMTGNGYVNVAQGFNQIAVVASTGIDLAQLFDTAQSDTFTSNDNQTELKSSNGYLVTTIGFDRVNVVAKYGGHDNAILIGSQGTDVLQANVNSVSLKDNNSQIRRVVGFENTTVDLRGGVDRAILTGSAGTERLTASYSEIEFETTLQLLQLRNTEDTGFDGNGGSDEVAFEEFGELDLLKSLGNKATAYLKDHTITAEEFSILEARSVDHAIAEYDLEAVDYLYMLRGQWKSKNRT